MITSMSHENQEFRVLSNDPGKNCTIFYCSDAISFPHIETVVFLGQEFLN